MGMIERIDSHPLSWPVATEFQKMKRSRPADQEDEKLFQEAEKKVAAEKRKRDPSAGKGPSPKQNDRFHFSRGNGEFLPKPLMSALFVSSWFSYIGIYLFSIVERNFVFSQRN